MKYCKLNFRLQNILIKIVFYFFLLNRCESSFGQDSIPYFIGVLVKPKIDEKANLFERFLKIGKPAIPFLIDAIDTKTSGLCGFQDPNSSTLGFFPKQYVGMRAAFMIEYILAKSDQPSILYQHGVIIRKNNRKLSKKNLTFAEMKSVKLIYQNWWKQNEKESIYKLQQKWKKQDRPLLNSGFEWF